MSIELDQLSEVSPLRQHYNWYDLAIYNAHIFSERAPFLPASAVIEGRGSPLSLKRNKYCDFAFERPSSLKMHGAS